MGPGYMDKRHRHDDRDLGHTQPLPSTGAPGKSTLSGKLHRRAAPGRDDNGVAAGAEADVERAASSGGAPLPGELQEQFGASLGTDLSSVRLHTGAESASAASAVGAKAYAVGQDIHFGAGQYDPSSQEGLFLIAHELAHTVQQQGSAPSPQHKLEVSTPGDAAEVEADRAADAMVAGRPAAVTSASGVARQTVHREAMKFEDDAVPLDSAGGAMERAADEAEQEARAAGKIHVKTPIAGTLKLEALSSLETTSQARECIAKVNAGNAGLYQRRAAQKARVDDLSSPNQWKEKEVADADLKKTDGFLSSNEGVIGSLQHIIDLGEGNSQLDEHGNRPGHDLRIGVFSKLAQKAFLDFARLQGVVSEFLAANPTNDQAGADGGKALGTHVATGGAGQTQQALDKIRGQVQDAQQDPALGLLIADYKKLHGALAGSGFDAKINAQMARCASAVSKAKNIQASIDLGFVRPETPEQAAAKAEADKVNADLAAAKAALNQAVDIAKLAISVMGMPEVGIELPGLPGDAQKVVDTGRKIDSGQAKFTGVALEKSVTDGITTAVGKMMTQYDERFNAAVGHADLANQNAKRQVATLDANQVAVAKGDIITEFNTLKQICIDVEKQKNALRDKSKEIAAYQNVQKAKGKKTGPDIGALTRAHSEATAYTVQAKAAIQQGEEEQKIAKEMSAERAKVAGDMRQTTGADAAPDMVGDRELASSTKEHAYISCESTAPFLLSQHPLSFRIRSEVLSRGEANASEDKAGRSVEVANMGVAAELDELKANLETATGFESALSAALGT